MSKTPSTTNSVEVPNDPEVDGKEYYHGTISREFAETLLTVHEQFLVRYTTAGRDRGYVISLNFHGKIRHFKVNYDSGSGDFYISRKGPQYHSIPRLIEDYIKERRSMVGLDKDKEGVFLKDGCDRIAWDFLRSDIEIEKKLGAGEFGEVFKGTHLGKTVAIKTCKKSDHHGMEKFEREAMICLKLNHENVVKTIGIVRSKGSGEPDDLTMIVMEFCAKGPLNRYLRAKQDVLTDEILVSFAMDACSGMAYLESTGIIHRDLATRNCLLSAQLTVKISDFGMAKEENYKMAKGMAPIRWMAPESIKYGTFSAESDVWTYGVVLWEIWSFGKEPYPNMKIQEIKKAVLLEKYRMSPPGGMPGFIASCMVACWDEKPEKRPTFHAMKQKLSSKNKADSPATATATTTKEKASASRNSSRNSTQRASSSDRKSSSPSITTRRKSQRSAEKLAQSSRNAKTAASIRSAREHKKQ